MSRLGAGGKRGFDIFLLNYRNYALFELIYSNLNFLIQIIENNSFFNNTIQDIYK